MSVARRRRGWPAWGSSLSNGTGARIQISQRLWAPRPLVRRGRAAADEAHTPSEGSALGACPPACLPGPHCCSPGPCQGCCRSFSRSRREPAGQPILRDPSGGKNQRRQEGRARWPRPASGQAGQSSPTGTAPAPLKPLSQALSAQRAWRSPLAEGSSGEPPGRAQPPRVSSRVDSTGAGGIQTGVGGLRSSTKP